MHSTAPSSTAERDYSYYHCCCGCHVHTGAWILALLLFLNHIGTSVTTITATDDPQYVKTLTVVLHVSGLIACVFLLVGNCCKIPVLYIPFVVLQFIDICLYMTLIVIEVLQLIDVIKDKTDSTGRTVTVGLMIGNLLFTMLTIYIFRVVYRDYQYVKGVTGNSVV